MLIYSVFHSRKGEEAMHRASRKGQVFPLVPQVPDGTEGLGQMRSFVQGPHDILDCSDGERLFRA